MTPIYPLASKRTRNISPRRHKITSAAGPVNDNTMRPELRITRRGKLSWKMEYFPRRILGVVGTETTYHQPDTQPLRVLMVKLEDEI